VTLDWAYADEARMAYQLTISGLTIPKGMRSSDIICPPYLSDDEGINYNHGLGLGGGGVILDDQPGKPIVVGKDLIQMIDASKFDYLHLHLDLTIGPCSPYKNASETNISKLPTIPVIGIYHIDFQVPVYKGITITPNQSVEAHGVTMQLESIRFNLSNIDLQVCYNLPHVPSPNYEDWAIQHFAITDNSWEINEVTIQMDESKPIDGSDSPFNGLQNGFSKKHCEAISFGVPSDGQPRKSVITIPELVADDDIGISTSPDWQKFARQQLTPQGIAVDFTPNGNSMWKIIKKPAGMTDNDAEQKIQDLFVHKYEGPWVFTVIKQP
jgi:hypothetical protein